MANADGFTLYSDTGEFGEQIASLEIATLTAQAAGKRVMSGRWDGADYYVVAGRLEYRPKLSPFSQVRLPADGVTAFAIASVPAGTRVRLGRAADGWQVINDGSFEFVTAHVETVRIEFEPPFPWQPLTIEIVSHAD